MSSASPSRSKAGMPLIGGEAPPNMNGDEKRELSDLLSARWLRGDATGDAGSRSCPSVSASVAAASAGDGIAGAARATACASAAAGAPTALLAAALCLDRDLEGADRFSRRVAGTRSVAFAAATVTECLAATQAMGLAAASASTGARNCSMSVSESSGKRHCERNSISKNHTVRRVERANALRTQRHQCLNVMRRDASDKKGKTSAYNYCQFGLHARHFRGYGLLTNECN
eukprot:6212692-Pleurochrysis_carterae.AAC.1